MPPGNVVRYRPGMTINPTEALEVVSLPSGEWGPIEKAYPELAAATYVDKQPDFRSQRTVVIWPPSYVSAGQLETLASSEGDDPRRTKRYVHPLRKNGKLVGVLVHLLGGYTSLHIYRLAK